MATVLRTEVGKLNTAGGMNLRRDEYNSFCTYSIHLTEEKKAYLATLLELKNKTEPNKELQTPSPERK